MAALQKLEDIINHFEPMDKDSICSDQPMIDLNNDSDYNMNYNQNNNPDEEEKKNINFDINSFECMPCEKNLLVNFKKWMELEYIDNHQSLKLRKQLHLKLLNQHPFVKRQGTNTILDYPNHTFTINRYQLNCRAFNTWCRKV